ncbi:hypothetical protein [Streptomyces catenulae]|uniref:Uncharacterized protein n=1 Tax=Streptomyces catenulae TaxID=66875 RepID=A0ABV2Z1I8_9ACTN|nr:hypothetical protein [Streptomyces catenulae]
MSTGDDHRTARPSPGGPTRPVEDRLRAALAARAATVEPRDLRPAAVPRAARRTSWLRGAPWRRFALPLAAAAAAAAIGYAVFAPDTAPPRPVPATTPDPLPTPTHDSRPSPSPSAPGTQEPPGPTRTEQPDGRTVSPRDLPPRGATRWTPSTEGRAPRIHGSPSGTPTSHPSESPTPSRSP